MVVHPELETDARGTDSGPWWWVLPIVGVLASYASVLTAGFVWDDYDLIVESPLITGHSSIAAHFSQPFWSNALVTSRSFYRPLISLSYSLDYRLWGAWAGGFHLTNVLLHLACTLLVAALCVRAGAGRPVACLLATAFALFPRLTESVAWVSGRTDPAAALGVLAAMLLYEPNDKNWHRNALAGACLLAALLCKEVALAGAMGLVLAAWFSTPQPRRPSRIALHLWPVWVAMLIYAALRISTMSKVLVGHIAHPRTPWTVLLLSTEAVARYAGMVLLPFRPRLQIGDIEQSRPLLSAVGVGLVIAAVLALGRFAKRRTRMEWMALGLGGTALALVAHIIPLDIKIVAADRFLYLPLAALAIAITSTIEKIWQLKPKVVLLASALILTSFGLATTVRARTWTNEIALWREEVAESSPGASLPRAELGVALMHRGRYDEALALLDQVRADQQSLVAINRATCLDKLGRRGEAIAVLEAFIRTQPTRARARINLMLMYARDLRFDDARVLGARLVAELDGRLDIQGLVSQIDQAAAEWGALPHESGAEPVATRARRAALFARIGALPEAQTLWAAVALDSRADSATRLRGATYLALFGRTDAARSVLDRLASAPDSSPGLAAQVPTLRAALAARFDDD